MEKILNIVKALLALGIIAALLMFGFAVFIILLGLAIIASLLMWFKNKNTVQGQKDSWETQTPQDHGRDADIMIIDGVAEEVTAKRNSDI